MSGLATFSFSTLNPKPSWVKRKGVGVDGGCGVVGCGDGGLSVDPVGCDVGTGVDGAGEEVAVDAVGDATQYELMLTASLAPLGTNQTELPLNTAPANALFPTPVSPAGHPLYPVMFPVDGSMRTT